MYPTNPQSDPTVAEIAAAIARFSAAQPAGAPRLWPALLGRTGTGKSTIAAEVATLLHADLRTLLIGTIPPHDLGGIPRALGGDGPNLRLEWALPAWAFASERPPLIFMDEADKAGGDQIAAVLTLLSAGRLRDRPMPAGTTYLAACQPLSPEVFLSDETGQALAARLIWIPVTREQAIRRLRDRYGLALSWVPSEPEPQVPVLPTPSPRQLEWVIQFAASPYATPAILQAVCHGIAPADQASALYEDLQTPNAAQVQPGEMLDQLLADPALIGQIPRATLELLIPHAWVHPRMTPEVLAAMHERLWTESSIEACSATVRETVALLDRWAQGRRSIEVLPGHDASEVLRQLWAAGQRACARRLAREGLTLEELQRQGKAP